MKIVCLIKFTPNVDDFVYNPITNVLDREQRKLLLNPDDASAIGLALKIKSINPNTTIEIVTMGPPSVAPMMKDLLRLGIERGTLLTDSRFAGSDTYATSKVLAAYMCKTTADLILTGSHSLDGDTAHIPSQVAEWLDLPHITYICDMDLQGIHTRTVTVTSSQENEEITLSVSLPAVLSVQKEIGIKLPFVRYADLKRNVDDQLFTYHCDDLGLSPENVGFSGSKTKVSKTFVTAWGNVADQQVVGCDAEGVQEVVAYLKAHGFFGGEASYES